MKYEPKLLPSKDICSFEDLKEIGFNCNNIIQVKSPCIAFNRETMEVLNFCENIPVGFEQISMKTQRIFPDSSEYSSLMNWYNSRKLIAWLPNKQPEGDIAHHVRLRVLVD